MRTYSRHFGVSARQHQGKQGRRVKKRKGIEAQEAELPTQTRAMDALIGEDEQHRKRRKKRKETGSGTPTQLPWTIWSPLTTRMDHTVGLF